MFENTDLAPLHSRGFKDSCNGTVESLPASPQSENMNWTIRTIAKPPQGGVWMVGSTVRR